jgi:hypothetical protein
MRFSLLVVFLLLASIAAAQGKQVPPGIRAADKADVAFEKSVPPPLISAQRKPPDLRPDADQLAKLAESIPADVESLRKGMLPKDVIQKLKQIEKLSKSLRSKLAN